MRSTARGRPGDAELAQAGVPLQAPDGLDGPYVHLSHPLGPPPLAVLQALLAATAVGAAPATFVYLYLGERAPQYVWVLLVAFGIVVAGAVVAAIVRRRSRGREIGHGASPFRFQNPHQSQTEDR